MSGACLAVPDEANLELRVAIYRNKGAPEETTAAAFPLFCARFEFWRGTGEEVVLIFCEHILVFNARLALRNQLSGLESSFFMTTVEI